MKQKNQTNLACPSKTEVAFTFLGGLCLAVLGIGLMFFMNKKSATKEAKNHSVMLKILFSALQVVHTNPNSPQRAYL